MSERHPIGYLGELVDVANAVLFLASDEARFITGAALTVTVDTLPDNMLHQLVSNTQSNITPR